MAHQSQWTLARDEPPRVRHHNESKAPGSHACSWIADQAFCTGPCPYRRFKASQAIPVATSTWAIGSSARNRLFYLNMQQYNSAWQPKGFLWRAPSPSTPPLHKPDTLPANGSPTYNGTVQSPGSSSTVDLVITGPCAYSETMQAVLNPNLPTPVPSLSGLGVASLSLLLAMVGMARGRKQ